MKNINFYLQWLKLTLAASLIIIPSPQILAIENSHDGFLLVQRPPLNQKKPLPNRKKPPSNQNQNSRAKVTFVQPPLGQGTPKGTVPGGSRGCPQAAPNPFTAVVPVTKYPDNTQLSWGLTTQAHPTFWYYLPYESESITSAKLFLRDRTNRKLYETSVKLTGTPGFVSISLPATAPSLENNQWYQVDLLVDISCFSDSDTQRLIAQAWVKKGTSTSALNKELQSATTLEKAILYAKNGFWFEALTTVAQLRRSNGQDPQWSYLLQSADLGDFANEPIVNCCVSQN